MHYQTILPTFCLFVCVTAKVSLFSEFTELRQSFSLEDKDRIQGGQEVKPHSFPYQISLQFSNGYHFCSGFIYNNNTVITSARCCNYKSPSSLKVVAGAHNLKEYSGKEQIVNISTIKKHDKFSIVSHDICLLKTEEPFNFSDIVSDISIPNQDEEFEGDAVVSGWGGYVFEGEYQNALRAVTLPLVAQKKCAKAYSLSVYDVDETMICAGGNGKDSCGGDAGGPLKCNGVICGIFSWGTGCKYSEYPGVYTKTSVFVNWIKEHAF